jgi:hypothetical protein
MNPQERQLVDDLFDRLSKVENAPRDPDATAAIADEALRRAHDRIQELEAAGKGEQPQSGGFLDSMRESIFGQGQQRGSVPNVRPPELPNRPTWNSGQVMQQAQGPGQSQGPGQYAQPAGQPYGAPQAPMGGAPMGGGGGSFLGTAAAAAAGTIGGSLLLGSIRSMMGGGHQQGFGDSAGLGGGSGGQKPWGDQSSSDLARDAGVNDIGSSGQRADDSSRSGLLDSDSNNDNSRSGWDTASNDDDHDDMDDSDDFDDGDSDTV